MVQSTAMQPSLDHTRQRLTPDVRSGKVRFTSILLEEPRNGGSRPALRGNGSVTFRLGVHPNIPTDVYCHIFEEDNGRFLVQLRAVFKSVSTDELVCSFVLPCDLPSARVCLVIEGRWADQIAGCEMSFDVKS